MTSQRALVTWALATFHTTLFVLLAITVLYGQGRFGATLASLNTLLGLGLFVVLWTSTYLTTRRALVKADLLTGDFDRVEFVRRALRYGAVNGVVFLAVLAAALIVGSMAATPAGGNRLGVLAVAVIAVPIAAAVATVVGAIVGVTLGAIDLALIAVARRIAGA
jgi:hypothetical protein